MARWWFPLLVALMPAWASAQVNALPSAPHILVRGHAEGRYIPDRFTIRLLVTATDPVPEQARARVEDHVQRIFAALDKAGALRNLTLAGDLQIQPRDEYRDGKSVFLGTQVSRGVEATFGAADKLKAFIGQLSAGEEVQVRNTHAWRSDMEALRAELRKRAMANAQEAGRQLAAAYGMRITGVYSVSDVAPEFAYGVRAGSWGGYGNDALGSSAPPAPPADITVSANRLPDADLRIGSIDATQDIYTVYLTAPQG